MKETVKLLACILVAFLLSAQCLLAQCEYYNELHRQGDRLQQKGDYVGAVQKYLAATVNCPGRAKYCVRKVFDIIKKLQKLVDEKHDGIGLARKESRELELKMAILEIKIRQASIRNDSLVKMAGLVTDLEESLHKLNEQIEDFFKSPAKCMPMLAKDTLGGRLQYIFTDSVGNQLMYLDTWDQAMPYDATGHAAVWRGGKAFILDLNGKPWSVDKFKTAYHEAGDYRYLQLEKFPRAVFKIENLKILWLTENQIPEFPEMLSRLYKLERLDAACNILKNIQPVEGLVSLLYLDLHQNSIEIIPFGIDRLKHLNQADFSYNRIEIVPPSLFRIASLTELRMAYNRIKVLPDKVGACRNLKHLDLSFNRIATLPESFKELQNLEYLGLSGNKILSRKASGVLDIIASLKNLQELHIGCNPCTRTELGRQQVKTFFQEKLPACMVYFN